MNMLMNRVRWDLLTRGEKALFIAAEKHNCEFLITENKGVPCRKETFFDNRYVYRLLLIEGNWYTYRTKEDRNETTFQYTKLSSELPYCSAALFRVATATEVAKCSPNCVDLKIRWEGTKAFITTGAGIQQLDACSLGRPVYGGYVLSEYLHKDSQSLFATHVRLVKL